MHHPHYIGYEKLYNVVLTDINAHLKLVKLSQESFLKEILKDNQIKQQKDLNRKQKEILRFEKRIEEINRLIKKIYEDRMNEKISEERFTVFLNDYEEEQKSIKESCGDLRLQLDEYKEQSEDVGRFLSIIQKYINLKELDANILNELIEKILIYDTQMIDGKKRQRIDIHYKFIGKLTSE